MEELELSFKDHSEAESRGGNPKLGAKCFIENNGKVNCSDIIYEDEKSWKQSRVQIDLLIKVLKNKISDLKDIKKHLKEHKPVHMKDYDEIPSIEDDDYAKDNRRTFRKSPHQHHFKHDAVSNNFENPTTDSTEPRKLDFNSSDTNKNYISLVKIDQDITIPPRMHTTTASPRLHNSHHRSKGNRTHLNSSRQHHGKKVNLEDLFAESSDRPTHKPKDKSTTKASTNSIKESDIMSSSTSTTKVFAEHTTVFSHREHEGTTRNYFHGLESSTKYFEDIHTSTPTSRKVSVSNELSGKFLN